MRGLGDGRADRRPDGRPEAPEQAGVELALARVPEDGVDRQPDDLGADVERVEAGRGHGRGRHVRHVGALAGDLDAGERVAERVHDAGRPVADGVDREPGPAAERVGGVLGRRPAERRPHLDDEERPAARAAERVGERARDRGDDGWVGAVIA